MFGSSGIAGMAEERELSGFLGRGALTREVGRRV